MGLSGLSRFCPDLRQFLLISITSCMDSASQPDTPAGEPPSPSSNLLGVLIAVLTLTLPLFMVAHFSSATESLERPPVFVVPASAGR